MGKRNVFGYLRRQGGQTILSVIGRDDYADLVHFLISMIISRNPRWTILYSMPRSGVNGFSASIRLASVKRLASVPLPAWVILCESLPIKPGWLDKLTTGSLIMTFGALASIRFNMPPTSE